MVSRTVKLFLVSFLAFAAVQFTLLKLFMYWRYPSVDIPMHLVGGVIVGLGVFAARDLHVPLFTYFTKPRRAILVVFVVAALWEGFEYATGMSRVERNFLRDTLADVALGLLGGLVGIWIGRSLDRRNHG